MTGCTSFFQIPIGEHPFPRGAVVECIDRPWWGAGVVSVGRGGVFTVRWADGMTSRGRDASGLALRIVVAGEVP